MFWRWQRLEHFLSEDRDAKFFGAMGPRAEIALVAFALLEELANGTLNL